MSNTARLYERVKSSAASTERNPVRGRWFNIRIQPDLFAGEQFNVGVGFVDEHGTVHSRFTDDLSRLQCFYDDRVDLEEIGFLVDMAAAQYDRSSFSKSADTPFSPQILLGELSYASGPSIQGILGDFFDETISLVPYTDEAKKRKPRFSSSSNESVREEVFNWMRTNHQLTARQIIPANPNFRIKIQDTSNTQEHIVELPLRAPGRVAGSIVSAYCKTPQTAELRILQAAITLNTAIRHLDGERCGMFILRPGDDSGLPRAILSRFDDLIDESVWKLRDAGVFVGVESSIPDLGAEIINWAA